MANLSFKRALAGVYRNEQGVPRRSGQTTSEDQDTDAVPLIADGDLERRDSIPLSDEISAARVYKLVITLRPLAATLGGSSPKLAASRWEVRKALLSLCSASPLLFEVEVTEKSAMIRVSFSSGAASEDLARKLRGVTVKIKRVKLHAFVRESESGKLDGGEGWEGLLGSGVGEDLKKRETAFNQLAPGRRPDTIVLRGIPANWIGQDGKPAEATSALGLEQMMAGIGPVRAVEVSPSVSDALRPRSSGSASAIGTESKSFAGSTARGARTTDSLDFDVHALLDGMPQPRALAAEKTRTGASKIGSGSAGGEGAGGVAAGLSVDAWVQFESFRGFLRALKGFRGRVLQKAGAELRCDYRLEADVAGYMTDERRRERKERRTREAKEAERRKIAVEKAREQLVALREGLKGLKGVEGEDSRPAVQEVVHPIVVKVAGHVGKVESILGAHQVDEPAATAAVAHARGEIAIARLSIRKAREGVDRAEEEERRRLEGEEDEKARKKAGTVLVELQDTLIRALAIVENNREHPGIQPQADKATKALETLSMACSTEGGSKRLKDENLVQEARKATDTATTRACMLQRFLKAFDRLAKIRALAEATPGAGAERSEELGTATATAAARTVSEGHGDGGRRLDTPEDETAGAREAAVTAVPEGGGGQELFSPGEAARNSPVAMSGDHGSGTARGREPNIVAIYVDKARESLSADLPGRSEGEILLMSESADEALDFASDMLATLDLVNSTRSRLMLVKEAMAQDPEVKSSESIMRIMAAAAISTGRAQREGSMKHSVAGDALKQQGNRWKEATHAADADVKVAEEEVERLTAALRQKRQREEEDRAAEKAERERRAKEEEAQRLELQLRAEERAIEQRRQVEAKIWAMELRRKELVAQVRNKTARERLRVLFASQRQLSGRKRARGEGGSIDRNDSEAGGKAATADRWTLEEGLEVGDGGGDQRHGTTSLADGEPDTATSTSLSRQGEHGLSPDRWVLSDGSAELTESGRASVGSGVCLLPSGEVGFGRKEARELGGEPPWGGEDERDWLALVSRRVRSEIVGGDSLDGCDEEFEDPGVREERVPLQEDSGGKISSVASNWKRERERQTGHGDASHCDDASICASTVRPAFAEQAGGPSLSASMSSSDASRGGKFDGEKGSSSALDKPFRSMGSIAEEAGVAVNRETEADLRRRLLATMSQARKKRKETSASGEESMAT